MANMNPVYGKWDYEYIQTYALRSAFKKHYCKNQHNQKKTCKEMRNKANIYFQ